MWPGLALRATPLPLKKNSKNTSHDLRFRYFRPQPPSPGLTDSILLILSYRLGRLAAHLSAAGGEELFISGGIFPQRRASDKKNDAQVRRNSLYWWCIRSSGFATGFRPCGVWRGSFIQECIGLNLQRAGKFDRLRPSSS